MNSTKKACKGFIDFPATIVSYLEGTRFTEEKRVNKRSPYQHLLKPKAGGMAIVMKEMEGHLAGVINATISYHPDKLSFWDFCCGNFNAIKCHYEVIPIRTEMMGDYTSDREFRKIFQAWLNQLWVTKDKQLSRFKASS